MSVGDMLTDIDGLNVGAGLEMYNRDVSRYIKALKSYKYVVSKTFEELTMLGSPGLMKTINETNMERYRLTVQSIMNASNKIKASKVAEYAKYLESAASAGDTDYINRFNTAFISYMKKIVSDIDVIIDDYYAKNPKPVQERPDGYLLAKLRRACRAFRVDIIDETMEEICNYQYENDAEFVRWLEMNVGLTAYGAVAERLLKN